MARGKKEAPEVKSVELSDEERKVIEVDRMNYQKEIERLTQSIHNLQGAVAYCNKLLGEVNDGRGS